MDALIRFVLRGLLFIARPFKRGGLHYGNVLNSFLGARAMMTGVEIGLFDALEAGPKSEAALIEQFGLDPDGARILLDACVNQNLIGFRRGEYVIRPKFRRWLAQAGVRADILHARLVYDDTAQLSRCVRGDWPADGDVRRFWGGNYQSASADESKAYTDYMQVTVSRSARFVVKAAPLAEAADVLDVGGGSGTLAIALAEAFPKLRVGILDLAPVEAEARVRIDAAGLSERITFVPGNFLERPLPTDWSTMMLHRVLWDWPDEPALILLGRILTALPSGGRLLVTEGMWSGDQAVDRILNSFHLYMCLGGFRLRGAEAVKALLTKAGFADVQEIKVLPLFMPMIIGVKP